MRLLLVRHGQSEWNAAGKWQGQANPPLTKLGLEQAREAAARIGAVDAIHASPLERAWETGSIISEEIGVGPLQVAPGLMERHAGAWQGLTRSQIEDQYPGYLAARKRPHDWEPDEQVKDRAVAALGSIAADHHQRSGLPAGGTAADTNAGAAAIGRIDTDARILVIAHSGVIYALESMLGAEHTRMANLGGRWLELAPSGWSLGERIELIDEPTMPGQI